MRTSPEVREQRKAAQLARLALKASADPSYAEKYASQPSEVRKAAEQGAQRKAIADAKRAIEASMGADARAATEAFGGQISASVGVVSDAAGKGSTA